jgi:hypothetical protein
MKLKELQSILCSKRGDLQLAIIYDVATGQDLRYGCSIEYAIKDYGEHEVQRISSWYAKDERRDYLVIDI